MFSIAAINDTDSKSQWEPLAPTKEAQEFHISQTYHEGLLKLQSKDYEMARKFLESVLDDPLVVNAQVESSASDGHLLQLRFLALKNLATVFLQQGSAYYENALHCYLQAVEIDSKDSVVWNQLGTLSCSMGSLSISRWAFEQGLLCSPNNWNCMEKLLEVLIAIGDEVACLSVAELILRHWPSHSRALLVKNTIEESEPVSFSPRGIDKLEPKHVRLEFPNKRKATNKSLDENVAIKKLNQTIELRLTEVSWSALTDALLEILLPGNVKSSEMGPEKVYKSGDVKLSIHLPSSLENVVDPPEGKSDNGEHLTFGDTERASNIRDREANILEEQPHERRSSRLERLRSRKPGKEESDACGKDPSKVVSRFLETFIAGAQHIGDTVGATTSSNSLDTEYSYVSRFVREASKNFGAYHVGHLLLEEIARRGLTHQAAFVKFLELEKVTRHWGKDRTCECSLFLAELYYDFGLCSSSASKRSKFMSEASYHLCKIVESVALDYPFHLNCFQGNGSCSSGKSFQETSGTTKNSTYHGSHAESSLLTSNCSFWIRFFWLSGRLSILDGKKGKAHEEFCISLSLLAKKEDADGSICALHLPHCKATKVLSIDRILYEVNMLKVDFLMEKSVAETIEKEMYLECVTLLSPLLFATKDVYIDALSFNIADRKDEMINSIEISALDILVKACQKTKPMDIEVYLNCHRRKLQILMAASGFDEYLSSCKPSHQNQGVYTLSSSDIDSKESSSKNYNHLIAKEVKALSQCVSQVKTFIDSSGDFNDNIVPVSSLVDIQTLLLSIISNAANTLLCRKSVPEVSDQVESCCFVDAAIVFCKLQHLNPTVPVKTQVQVDLIVAMHDLLAEYGLCCAGEGGAGEEGAFLRFAIKHLLALDVKFKSNFNPFNRERTRYEEKISQNSLVKTSLNESKSDTLDVQMERTKIDEASGVEKDASEELSSKGTSSHKAHNKDTAGVEYGNEGRAVSNCKFNRGENSTNQLIECGSELNEDEKEQLESKIDNALDQCFFCLYGLNLRSDSSYEDDLVMHRNTSRGDYQTKEQCADVFQYILPYAKASSRTGLIKLRRVLRAIRKHFPQPPEDVLTGNPIDKFLDDLGLCEDQLSEEAGSDEFLETISKTIFPDAGGLTHYKASTFVSSEPYLEVYCNLYYFLALSEEMSATDKWPGFVLTKEGEEFVQQNAKLFKFDLLYNPLRFQSWQRLANIYDEEVDLLLNDGSKHINVVGWRKNATLPQRVETSRRRSRRCLLMSLALANTSAQQCEIHELLALVYYDSLQNVVPFYDQRSAVPTKDAAWMMFCENSMKHFKKAYTHKQDWLYAFYLGKLSEKLGCSHDAALSYYDRAIALNPSAVDPVYRMHASRLKLLYTCGKHNSEALKILSAYSFNQSVGEAVTNIFCEIDSSLNTKDRIVQANFEEKKCEGLVKLEEVWHMLYNDCLSGLETCVEGDLKHFHKARYMLAQGLYKRGGNGDLERAKDELSFCFKSSRSSFTINMWEIDSMVKKGRRKTPGSSGNKKVLEVNLPESSRKFITCIRKYVLLYLKLLEETGDICTLDRAYISLRADKRFSLCIEDIVPVALGRHLKALISSMHQPQNISSDAASSTEQVLEKMFGLFMEHGNLWPEICSLPEIKSPDVSDNGLYGYLHEHIVSLERDGKLETLEAINEKIRKRFKNPKLSNSNCAKVCRHASVAWCRSLINSLASITPLQPGFLSEIRDLNSTDGGMDTLQLLCVDLQTRELWNTAFEDSTNSKNLKTKWSPVLSKIKNIMIKKASDENLETANALLRSSYNFYRESSCVLLTSGVNLYLVSSRLALDTQFHPSMNGVETLDLSIPRKLLLWAYTLLHGRYTNISVVVKHCEENVKSKVKRGSGTSSVSSNPSCAAASHTSSAKDVDMEATPMATVASASLPGGNNTQIVNSLPSSGETQKNYFASPQLHQCNNTVAERTDLMAHEGGPDKS